ncbi:hypothetical protein ASF28_07805 [Methylobacterium sp. Leaf99]|nr:hypothetical protein ASF28_07805 [Methylobacterium sp. Leaf99]
MIPRAPQDADAPDAARAAFDAERAALRLRIAEEVVRQGGHPLARRTLQLLAEAAVEPDPAPPGYRILDRDGRPRRITDPAPLAEDRTSSKGKASSKDKASSKGKPPARTKAAAEGETLAAAGPDRAMTLADVVTDLRVRHPALFVQPEADDPAATAASPTEAPPPEVKITTEAPSKPGAAARFVAVRSSQVRTALAGTATRGRALSAGAAEGWRTLRGRLTPSRPSTPAEAPPAAGPPSAEPAAAGTGRLGPVLGPFLGHVAGQVRGRLADAGGRLRGAGHEGGALRDRRILAAGAGLVALAAAITLIPRSDDDTAAPSTPPSAPTDAAPRSEAAVPPAAPAETTAPAEEAAKPTNALAGPAEVIDTATLRVAGKLVRLFGVEWVRGGQADELTRYLAGRTVTCQPVAGSEARLCNVEGRDLSEVVLFNGGGRASSEATPDLVAAEDRARSERLGVWAR